MNIIIKIGKPIHFRPTNENRSACGVEHPDEASYDGRDVDCLKCRRTKSWKVYMGVWKERQELFKHGLSNFKNTEEYEKYYKPFPKETL